MVSMTRSFMIVRPPGTTLFPYTTLFRSQRHHRGRRGRGGHRPDPSGLALQPAQGGGERAVLGQQVRSHPVEQDQHIDRKSTRLNSSHVANSYAVFCLKKKRASITY